MNKHQQKAFILPMLIVFSVVLMSAGLVVMQYVASSTNSIQTAFYNKLAKEAANSGAALALSCYKQAGSITVSPWATNGRLTPASSYGCTGQPTSDTGKYYMQQMTNPTVKVSFNVPKPDASDVTTSGTKVKSTGTVEFFYGSSTTPTQTFTQTTYLNIPNDLSAGNIPIAQGKAVTQLSSGQSFSCAVANQELYCWGANNMGQLGLVSCAVALLNWQCATSALGAQNVPTPTRVNGGSLGNKRVDSVSAGSLAGCAVVEGRGMCWGGNSHGQLGDGSTSLIDLFNTFNIFIPTDLFYFGLDKLVLGPRSQPVYVQGALANQNVTKMSYGWSAGTFPDRAAVCGLSNGKVSCWGANNYGQLGQPTYNNAPAGSSGQICAPPFNWPCAPIPFSAQSCNGWETANNTILGFYTYTTQYLCPHIDATPPTTFLTNTSDIKVPTYVFGFANRPGEQNAAWTLLAGKRAADLSTGMTGVCLATADGKPYCWGSFTVGINSNDAMIHGLTVKGTSTPLGGDLASVKKVSKIIAGDATGCALTDGSGAYCWGRLRGNGVDSLNDTPTAVPGLAGIPLDDLSVRDELNGPLCMLGLGNAYCWGKNQPNVLSPMLFTTGVMNLPNYRITSMGTGGGSDITSGLLDFFKTPGSSCMVLNATPYCAGKNTEGQLGTGNKVDSPYEFLRTTNVIGLTAGQAATQIDAGDGFNCTIVNGAPLCWGRNDKGQLGSGDLINQAHPTGVAQMYNRYSTKVSAGGGHACSITEGKVWCWGGNANGQVGVGASNPQLLARQVTGGGIDAANMIATDVSTGTDHTCAVVNYKAYCWGNNASGQLGTGNTTSSSTPVAVRANSGDELYNKMVTKVAAGNGFTCAIADGMPYCWGSRTNGKVGDNSTSGNATVAAAVQGFSGGTVTDIQAGDQFACMIEGGVTKCWGLNSNGQLGINSTTSRSTASAGINVIGSLNTTSLSLGSNHACAVASGKAYCWGYREKGKIGDGSSSNLTSNSQVPVQVIESTGNTLLGETNKPVQITAGSTSSCSIANGKIFCWGKNDYGQLGNDTVTSTDMVTPTVTANYRQTATVIAWDKVVFY